MKIAIAVPHFQRFAMLLECIKEIQDDPRVGEIVISDDCSQDGSWEKLREHFANHPTVTLYRNDKNYDCYRNKQAACLRTTHDWAVLIDDDNRLSKGYLDVLFALPRWEEDTVYCPELAFPHFDYREFSGLLVDRHNAVRNMHKPSFRTMLNTANYFFHVPTWLNAFDASVNPNTADSIYHAYNLLRNGNKLFVTPGLKYFHRVHDGSHYKRNVHKTGDFAREVEEKLKALR